MFSRFKRLLGNITVSTKNSVVTVEGVPADVIAKSIKRIWGTSRIEANMFNEIDSSSFSFNEFFCVDVLYAVDRLLQDMSTGVSVRTLTKIKELLLEKTWLANTRIDYPTKLDTSKLSDFHFTPMQSQLDFMTIYDQTTQRYGLRGMLLAAAAGGGKSTASLMLMASVGVDQVVIVSPNNALYRVWDATIRSAFKTPKTHWVSKDSKALNGSEDFIVVNYEYVGKLTEQLSKLTGKKIGVILDESHNFNTHDSLRTMAFLEMCRRLSAKEIVWLSGTPVKAIATEAIPLFRAIDPTFTPDSEARFRKIFGASSERGADIMKNRLGISLFYVPKSDQKLEEPLAKEIKVRIPNGDIFTLEAISKQMAAFTLERREYYRARSKADLSIYDQCLSIHQRSLRSAKEMEQYDYYRKCVAIVIRSGGDARVAKDEMIYCNRYEATRILPTLPKELKAPFKDTKSVIKYVNLKIQGECLGRIVGRARIDAHVALCEHLDYVAIAEASPKKTIVFTSFVEVVEKLQKTLPTLGLDPLFVYAKTNAQLASIVESFDKNEDLNPLIATYASLSTAVPLTMADQVVLIDSPFRDYILAQSIARVWRIGATTRVTVYTALLDTGNKPNISTRSLDILKWSVQQVEALTGVVSPFTLTNDLDASNVALESYELSPIATPTNSISTALEAHTGLPSATVPTAPSYFTW